MARLTAFIGFMGAGKTTAARGLAAARGVAHLDADALVEERLGRPIQEVFDTDGEAAFRSAEEQVVAELLERGDEVVVSLGGGAVRSERVQSALAGCTTVLVDIGVDEAWARATAAGAPERPLARDRDAFARLHAERAPLYERLADAFLPQADVDCVVRADPALRALEQARADGLPVRLAWAHAASGEYPVFVGAGALRVRPPGLAGRAVCVTDEAVAEHHLGSLAGLSGVIEIPPGEEHKTLETAERVWRALAAQGVTRADHLVALGGGVVGDLAGFCAACFQRGIAVVQAPTTVVSQVDSAYGGKTGVDLPEAKNYVGAYHQPAAVLADTTTLATLPPEEHAAGYAEVLKTALIAGGTLWERIADGAPVDDDVILACARTKLAVVAADERDGGRRQVLNLGHTVGHALETVLGYGTLRHGEAVGLGLLAALRLSGQPELREQCEQLLEAAGLPTRTPGGVDPEAIVGATRLDKKRTSQARTPFVLVRAAGDVVHGQDVADDDVLAAVRELRP
ncbi:MAG TPA: bifunctional shikimate kinase/3-dehydroquinate synthase [Baekduia sp.]|nr:bifunctional shikimate kinase/3-dehydroquinate synthase [Baekduia sp.]